MKDAAKRPPSPVSSNANLLPAFFTEHPHAAWTIAKGAGIGAALGIGAGLGLPGRGAWFRVAVMLLVSLGFALIGGLITAARVIPRTRAKNPDKREWAAKVEAKMKSGSSSPTPRRIATTEDKGN